jgi:hypothetical protein
MKKSAHRPMMLTRRSPTGLTVEAGRDLDRYLLRADRIDRHIRIDVGRLTLRQSSSLRGGRKGVFNNATGRSRSGETTKIHALHPR